MWGNNHDDCWERERERERSFIKLFITKHLERDRGLYLVWRMAVDSEGFVTCFVIHNFNLNVTRSFIVCITRINVAITRVIVKSLWLTDRSTITRSPKPRDFVQLIAGLVYPCTNLCALNLINARDLPANFGILDTRIFRRQVVYIDITCPRYAFRERTMQLIAGAAIRIRSGIICDSVQEALIVRRVACGYESDPWKGSFSV